jgi:hypothetical protein
MWDFKIDPERRAGLLRAPSYDSLVAQIVREMTPLCYHRDICKDNNKFSRAIYCIKVNQNLFDLFFNSRNGYRAAYYESPFRGNEANLQLLERVAQALIGWAATRDPLCDTAFIKESLRTFSAKAWLTEYGIELDDCKECLGEWRPAADDTPEIINGKWEHSLLPNSTNGRKAPYLTKIKIIGAFLNDKHDLFVAARKLRREWDIHECGWS